MALVFVDASAFVALLLKTDGHHKEATAVYNDLQNSRAKLITTNHIIDETCTWFARDLHTGHKVAVQFGLSMLQNPNVSYWHPSDDIPANSKFLVVSTSPEIERRALTIFTKYDTAGFSFTDCISFAAMQKLGIKKAFAFDHHFDILGFERL